MISSCETGTWLASERKFKRTTTTTTTTTTSNKRRTMEHFLSSLLVILALINLGPTTTGAAGAAGGGGQLTSAELIRGKSECVASQRLVRPGNASSTARVAGPLARWSPYEHDYQRAAELCRQKLASGHLDELCYTWRFRYIDEQNGDGNEVSILDRSIDERVANSIYTAISTRVVDMDFFKLNSGDPELDRRNLASITGPQVDDQVCGRQLAAMLDLLEQFEARLERKRQNASFELGVGPEHIRLARVLDSFGRYESGLMLGKTHAIGSFDQCVTSRLLLPAAPATGDRAMEKVRTRFCWARMDLGAHLSGQLRERKSPVFESQEKVFMLATCLPESCHTRSFLESAGEQAHTNRKLAQRLIDTQFKMPKSLFIEETRPLKTINCLVDSESEFSIPLAGKVALVLLVCWLLLAVYATYYQELRPRASNKKTDELRLTTGANLVEGNRWAQALIDCLNLKKSWQDFIEEPYDEHRRALASNGQSAHGAPAANRHVELDVLNPIKTFGAGFVVLGHSVIIHGSSAMNSLRAYNIIENDPVVLSMIVGTVVVDTFFVITGVLMAYVAMRKSVRAEPGAHKRPKLEVSTNSANNSNGSQVASAQEHQQPAPHEQQMEQLTTKGESRARHSQVVVLVRQWARFAILRHLRLLPLFFFVYWFKRSVFIDLIGFGQPLWDNGFNKDTLFGSCKQESWLVPFTMMTSFLPLSKQCLPQSWSISTDLFFSVVVTPLVLVLTRRPKLACALAVALGLASYTWTLQAYAQMPLHMAAELSHMRSHGFAFMFGHLHNLYTYPHFRLTSVLVGVLVGYALHLYQERAPNCAWPQWIRGWATKASILSVGSLFVTVIFIPHTKALMAPYERQVFTHLFTTGRIVWALANGVFILRMSTDWKDSFLMRQFATSYWSKLVKLNLAILLVHMDILMYQMGNSTTFSFFTIQNVFVLYGSTYLLCIPVAIFLHIAIENPIDKLMRRHVVPHVLV